MNYVETSSQSWFSRIGGSIKGILFGFVFVAGGVALLFWGEGRAVKRTKTLKEGAGVVVSVQSNRVDSSHDGGLVHLSGRAETADTLADEEFGVGQAGALSLSRDVEMYQWVEDQKSEEKKKLGGGTETVTTYSYRTDWSSQAIDSSSFKVSEGHANPSFPFSSKSWQADRVTVGSFTLGSGLQSQVSRSERIAVSDEDLARLGDRAAEFQVAEGRFYWGRNPGSPEVGDVRIGFAAVPPADVSIVAKQTGDRLEGYKTEVGGTISLLDYGSRGADEMFQSAHAANTGLTWVLRVVGFFVVFIGFASIFKPLSVLADVVPFLGNLAETGVTLISFMLAAVVSLVTIAIGWIVFRPLLGITLLIAAGAFGYWIVKKLRARRPAASAVPQPAPAPMAPPPPPPPPPPA